MWKGWTNKWMNETKETNKYKLTKKAQKVKHTLGLPVTWLDNPDDNVANNILFASFKNIIKNNNETLLLGFFLFG